MDTWIRSTFCSTGTCVEVAWAVSSFCANGACVTVGWQRSTRCSNNGCVEVAHEDGRVLLRDSKKGDQSPQFAFTPTSWRVFVTVAADWDRETATLASGVTISKLTGVVGDVCLIDDILRHLHFTWEEWDAFVAGVRAGEFTAEAVAS
jgi:hypothetical protein